MSRSEKKWYYFPKKVALSIQTYSTIDNVEISASQSNTAQTMNRTTKYKRFYEVVNRIPLGKVATYGQIAILAGFPGQARQVGYALNALPENLEIPWQRVINAKGQISPRSNPIYEEIQRQLLEAEGIQFDLKGQIDLKKYQWNPEKS